MLPEGYRIVGASRDDLSGDAFRDFARRAVEEFGILKPAQGDWDAFADRLQYVPGDFGPGASKALADAVDKAEADLGGARRLYFFAVPPVAFRPIVRGLDEAGLATGARVIIEKPFGSDA